MIQQEHEKKIKKWK